MDVWMRKQTWWTCTPVIVFVFETIFVHKKYILQRLAPQNTESLMDLEPLALRFGSKVQNC